MQDQMPFDEVEIDGKRYKKVDCVRRLLHHPEDPSIMAASDGTMYKRNANGSLVRTNKVRMTKAEKKAARRVAIRGNA